MIRFGNVARVLMVLVVIGWLIVVGQRDRESSAEAGGNRHPTESTNHSATVVVQEQASDAEGLTAVRLTGSQTEDDYPALAKAPDGSVWLTYVEYVKGRPIDMKQVLDRRFDSLITQGHGDRIRLLRFDGTTWSEPINVTKSGLEVWRPTVAIDGDGNVTVAWAESVDGDWEVFYRKYQPAAGDDGATSGGRWSAVVRVTNAPGADFHVVSATDASGRVWLAWQGWRNGSFDIHAASIKENDDVAVFEKLPNTQANEWSPAIAADSSGNVYVAWDTYDEGNYDVRLQVIGKNERSLTVAGSARFEARPSLACDADDRLWIAYEEGDEQWGKDYSVPVIWGRNRGEVDPGFGLYDRRGLRVKCLDGGRLRQPAESLDAALGGKEAGNTSLPRIAIDDAGGLWLLLRRHRQPRSRNGGEVWHSFAVRFDGRQWSQPMLMPQSSNLMDNRPAMAPLSDGLLVVYSGDTRTRTQKRDQNDLFAASLQESGPVSAPQLVDHVTPEAHLPDVHADEAADVARMRRFRVQYAGKALRLLRGDFHRHTEYTSHRDGDGLLEDSWRYALDAGGLDWMGNGDHDNGYGHEYHWWQIQKMTELVHHPPTFVAVHSYERSNVFPNGHRNVIFPRRGIRPLPRGSLKGTPETGTPDTKLLYDYLKHFGGMCASHTSGTGMGTDWRDNDPDVEPVVEIFQGARQNYQSYEHLGAPRAAPKGAQPARFDSGYVWSALAKGYRLGFESSSDHYSTHISYAVVLAEDTSRQAIIDAFKQRHCYAANDNILLMVRSGEHLMGDAFETTELPTLQISVHGVRRIVKLHVIRNNAYVLNVEPRKRTVQLEYTDADASIGKSYYYVRVEQEDGSLAWASPMWITYKGGQ